MTDYLLQLRQWTEDLERISGVMDTYILDNPRSRLSSLVYEAAQEAERLLEEAEIQEVRIIKLKDMG